MTLSIFVIDANCLCTVLSVHGAIVDIVYSSRQLRELLIL